MQMEGNRLPEKAQKNMKNMKNSEEVRKGPKGSERVRKGPKVCPGSVWTWALMESSWTFESQHCSWGAMSPVSARCDGAGRHGMVPGPVNWFELV